MESFWNRPGDTSAKTTGMEGSVAVPMLVNGELRGVLGIAKATAYDWSDGEKAELFSIAAELGSALKSS